MSWLTLNEDAFRNLRIDLLHQKLNPIWRGSRDDCCRVRYNPRHANRAGFRVVFAERTPSGNRVRVRFRLDRPVPRSTLLVLGDHFTEVGLDWLAIYTAEGSPALTRYLPIHQQPSAV